MAFGSAAFIVGLSMMPVAENTAIAFLGPLFITALSVPLLGETVGIRRWMAALVGFLGVMIVVRPGSEAFQPAAIFPMVAALIGAFGVILTRHMANEAPEATLSWTGLSGFVVMTALMPFFWSAPDLTQVALGLGSGLLSTVGHAFVVLAFRRAGASTLAPFTYVQLLFAGFFAYLVFSTVPSLWTVAGGVVIAASGLYTAHRERVRAAEARRALG
jgi:drug/metabolite transporter (DMT)-like permease